MSPRGGARRGAGRKRLDRSEKRSVRVALALTEAEAELLARAATEQDCSLAAYAHQVLVRHLRRRLGASKTKRRGEAR